MGIQLVFSLKIMSDYHISSGVGLGKRIDSALSKDQEDNPVIRGSSLSGLMRSAAHELCQTYPVISDVWKEVFGVGTKSKSWAFRSAELLETEHRPYGQKRLIGERTGVRIDPELRRSQEKKLFAKEIGSSGLEFTFEVEYLGEKGREKDGAALLVAAARMVRALGSSVNRGYGKCLITLLKVEGIKDDVNQDDLLDHFVQMLFGHERARGFGQPVKEPPTGANYNKVMVLAKVVEPLIIAQGGIDGNEYDTGVYIPGQTLLGAFASRYIRDFGLHDYDKFLELFRYGGLKFTPLYLCRDKDLDSELVPSIPMPQDMLTCKRHPFNTAHRHSVSLKGYATFSGPETCSIGACAGRVPLISVEGFIATRWNEIPDSNVRPNVIFEPHVAMRDGERRADEGKFFAYNAMEPGQYFYGEIKSENPELLQSILSMGEEKGGFWQTDILIGKGITRGYGKLNLVLKPAKDSHFNPLPLRDRVGKKDAISLLFLSDTILLDPWGRTISAGTSEALSKLLGINVDIIRPFITLKDVEGFTAVTGLPRFRDLAIKAGSVIGFRCAGDESLSEVQSALEAIENTGLGLRRHEGFGMVSFNHVVYAMDSFRKQLQPILNPFAWGRKRRKQGWPDIERDLAWSLDGMNMSLCDRELARWLYANRLKSSDELIGLVSKYGEINVLKEFNIESRDKGDRTVDLRKQIRKVLTRISDVLENRLLKYEESEKGILEEEIWPLCVEWLAEKIIDSEERAKT